MTVSRVLNQPTRVAPATRHRVERAIRELGFVPNALARSLLRGRTKTIALVVADLSNPFFTAVARGVEDIAHRYGYTVFFGNSDESVAKEGQYINSMLQNRVDGLLIAPATDGSLDALEFLHRQGRKVVLIDRSVAGAAADLVAGDNVAGARHLTEHLLHLGHRRIGLANGSPAVSTARERQRGYQQALGAQQIELDPTLVVEGAFTRAAGRNAVRQLMRLPPQLRPTAIFACNNLLAIGVLTALREAQIQVPNDIAVVSFDDLELASELYPFLTVVAQPAHTFGTIAMQFLLDRLEGNLDVPPRTVLLPTQLIVRQSCGATMTR